MNAPLAAMLTLLAALAVALVLAGCGGKSSSGSSTKHDDLDDAQARNETGLLTPRGGRASGSDRCFRGVAHGARR